MADLETIAAMMNLDGKVAFVTGAAMGIGESIAVRLHQAGASVVIADLDREKADALAADLNAQRADSAASFALDVSKADQVENAFAFSVETFGHVDILVNNAGIYPMIPLATMTEDDFMKVINVNLRSVFLTTKAASEHMKTKGIKGKIINVTSIDAIHPSMVGLAHYDSSKHGEWGFTKNAALELAAFGIAVNAIAPGAIATPGTGVVGGDIPDALKPFVERIPMGRMGTGDDIAKVALFLASDLSSYMTGEQVVVDGGMLLR